MSYLVIGAGGFLGSSIAASIDSDLLYITARKSTGISCIKEYFLDISDLSDSQEIFSENISVVIHCAARAHIMNDTDSDSFSIYRRINSHAVVSLAAQAARSGVKRFVFVSSIGVNGKSSLLPFTELDDQAPYNHYSFSKSEAEKGLLDIAVETDMEVVIIRPPLVYGPNPPGNFASLLTLIKKGYPLPLGLVTHNKRSLIALDNLVNFILLCADYKKTPQAANQIFVISDGEDVSTAELFERVAKAYGKKSRLFPFPSGMLRLGAKLLGKQAMIDRLLSSLQIDSSKARELLGWKPVITMGEQLEKIAKAEGYSK